MKNMKKDVFENFLQQKGVFWSSVLLSFEMVARFFNGWEEKRSGRYKEKMWLYFWYHG